MLKLRLINQLLYIFVNMKTPSLPSFFKTQKAKQFTFIPRYYNERKERINNINKEEKYVLPFDYKKRNHSLAKGKRYQIIFFIIILSLLTYKLLIS